MAQNRKSKPQVAPQDLGSLSTSLRKAVVEVDAAKKICVRLRISGGMPAQAYRFEFTTNGGTSVSCQLNNARDDSPRAAEAVALSNVTFTKLLKQIDASGILERASEPPVFLPDTLVGMLEISDGQSTHRVWFAADKVQAEVQQKKVPPELSKIVDAIYALGAQLLKQPSIKP